ncbi:MAG: hypothetical protein V3T53_00380 [Phycisphaerales bacterium]
MYRRSPARLELAGLGQSLEYRNRARAAYQCAADHSHVRRWINPVVLKSEDHYTDEFAGEPHRRPQQLILDGSASLGAGDAPHRSAKQSDCNDLDQIMV